MNNIIDATETKSKWKAVKASLGIPDKKLESSFLKLYPNPTKNEFTVEFGQMGKVSVAIYDILGKLMYTNTTTDDKMIVQNNGQFKSGVYIVKVSTESNNSYYTKLVIE